MKTVQVIINYSGLRDLELLGRTNTIAMAMTGNVYFPELAADVDQIKAANAGFSEGLARFDQTGSKADKALKDDCRGTVLGLVHDLCVRINLKAKGNRAVLETTGCLLTKDPEVRKDRLAKPEGVKVKSVAGTGSATVTTEGVDGAHAYLYEYTKAPVTIDSQWISIQISGASCTIDGLELDQRYAFRAAGIGKVRGMVFSDVVTCMVSA